MSGVNAHAIFSQIHPGTAEGGSAKAAAVLHRQRFWPFPWPQKMAVRVGCTPGRALFVADLHAPELAYLSDHKVCFTIIVTDCQAEQSAQILPKARQTGTDVENICANSW